MMQQYQELVAADPKCHVALPKTPAEQIGHSLKQLVPAFVPKLVVRCFETVQVDHQHRHFVAVVVRRAKDIIQFVPGIQPREVVSFGFPAKVVGSPSPMPEQKEQISTHKVPDDQYPQQGSGPRPTDFRG